MKRQQGKITSFNKVERLMIYKDLRDFIQHLESLQQLKRISLEIDPKFEHKKTPILDFKIEVFLLIITKQ